jgi:hypothetical protein
MEIISHLLGTCGESHPNVISLVLIGAVVWCAASYVWTAVRAR